jgi:cytochrome c peroxidase
MFRLLFATTIALVLSLSLARAEDDAGLAKLGEALFFDVNLSKNRTQACATCHAPDHAFTDPRETAAGRAASLGDDGTSLGDRNAPTAAYASFTPAFGKNAKGRWAGGQFHDGREAGLEGQAGGPPLNPLEMAMPSKAAVAERLKENPDYVSRFQKAFGKDVFADDERAYATMTRAIAAFERTPLFQTFDSKYDRALRGEYTFTDEEELGRVLFFSNQFTNCSKCHQLKPLGGADGETFSNYEFHNIGVPANAELRAVNGVPQGHVDGGLLENAAVGGDPAQKGKFKTPTLRNVAVTGPYMHNGVFKDLRTVILFYNKYNAKAARRQINPETGKDWDPPEVDGTLSLEELTSGPALKDREIDALVAFLKTLTDKRFEPLIAP